MTARPPQSMSSAVSPDTTNDDLHDRHAQLRDAAAAIAAAVNNRSVQANSSIDFSFSTTDLAPGASTAPISPSGKAPSSATPFFTNIQFRSQTTAPSPPPSQQPCAESATAQKPGELAADAFPAPPPYQRSPLRGDPTRLRTDLAPVTPIKSDSLTRPSGFLQHKTSASSLRPISRTPSLKASGVFAFGPASAASSTVPSPIITAMGNVTPLPSPLLSSDSPGPWKALRPPSRDTPAPVPMSSESALVTSTGESIASALATQSKRKAYASLAPGSGGLDSNAETHQGAKAAGTQVHTRNRSTSEYIPDPVHMPKRMTTVSGSHAKLDAKSMRREPHLSESRGLTPVEKPPTPPPSESSLSVTESASVVGSGSTAASKKPGSEMFEAYGRRDRKLRRWRAIRMLGQGTFSRVMLATSQISPSVSDEEHLSATSMPSPPQAQPPRRTLVAVKVCEHGPRGGASEDRIEMSLKRELEIMQSIDHPSLVHLKAWNIEPTRAILVLSYCPGGDLFDVASTHRQALTPNLLRRMFAELVGAVQYLHERRIVHRDIKLENVLVNLSPAELSRTSDWGMYPYSVITLTDLGLSRRIADDERLETRCGSDDYAAPEVIMGQPYDGRATDAWSLGVLLYALLEGRLPFDPPPGIGDHAMQMRLRSRTSHRIARAEWRWIEYGADNNEEGDGDHEADVKKFQAKGLTGAMEVVEGLLKRARSRWPIAKVAENEWVRGGIQLDGGLCFHEEEEGEEVL